MITVKNLTKSYQGQVVLHDFNATFQTGLLTCVLGASGIGKTTLLRLLMGLESPDSGTILGLDGLRPSVVFQEDRLCQGLTLETNLLLPHIHKPSPLTLSTLQQGLQALDLSGNEHKLVQQLSGGMMRRTALLRALLIPFDILFLDEPFKGLDGETKIKTMDYLKAQTQGKTVICITHDPSEVSYLNPQNILHIPSQQNGDFS
ncbi:ATP-binding cassette domain-containing protein [Bengtsoniella intestinalis]|uniref:ATP-binding cassette domain-containing protein n=1 Tax=Bengtsoniella intestinalis TaxID=3073143 RepID=UPI00391EEE70